MKRCQFNTSFKDFITMQPLVSDVFLGKYKGHYVSGSIFGLVAHVARLYNPQKNISLFDLSEALLKKTSIIKSVSYHSGDEHFSFTEYAYIASKRRIRKWIKQNLNKYLVKNKNVVDVKSAMVTIPKECIINFDVNAHNQGQVK